MRVKGKPMTDLRKLSDADLSALVAEKVMGWHTEERGHKSSFFGVRSYWICEDSRMKFACDEWLPAEDRNQLHAAERRIEEMGLAVEYVVQREWLAEQQQRGELISHVQFMWDLLTMSCRLCAEAMVMAVEEKGE